MSADIRESAEAVASLICDAGGKLVGRTRLQKIAYLAEAMGFGFGFDFRYKHYGPFSENLSLAIKSAQSFDLVKEDVNSTSWGGFYSIYTACSGVKSDIPERRHFIEFGAESDPVELELAATSVLLASEGYDDPWSETTKRKPDKSAQSLEGAKALVQKLKVFDTQHKLPTSVF